jgi:hypothetical protein
MMLKIVLVMENKNSLPVEPKCHTNFRVSPSQPQPILPPFLKGGYDFEDRLMQLIDAKRELIITSHGKRERFWRVSSNWFQA